MNRLQIEFMLDKESRQNIELHSERIPRSCGVSERIKKMVNSLQSREALPLGRTFPAVYCRLLQ